MSVTVDCGEGRHTICSGKGRTAWMYPQESRGFDEEPFNCGCPCHHDGRGVPCAECPAPLFVWTVYDHPSDYPDHYVARLWRVTAGVEHSTESMIQASSLAVLRETLLVEMGLTCIPRSDDDDSTIVESWL